ncbi:hypothetical protein AB0B50_28735 [Streptomyces sp. NPDC041068]|uniref:hypothetical protein n=1 Tax=Streptomyces sp. NPDC041068 TaxID=3155130 RepID=UPI0033C969B0
MPLATSARPWLCTATAAAVTVGLWVAAPATACDGPPPVIIADHVNVYYISGDGNLTGDHIIVGNSNNVHSHNHSPGGVNAANGNNSSGNAAPAAPSLLATKDDRYGAPDHTRPYRPGAAEDHVSLSIFLDDPVRPCFAGRPRR